LGMFFVYESWISVYNNYCDGGKCIGYPVNNLLNIAFIFLICLPLASMCLGCYVESNSTQVALRWYSCIALILFGFGMIGLVWEIISYSIVLHNQYEYIKSSPTDIGHHWSGFLAIFIIYEFWNLMLLLLLVNTILLLSKQ